MRNGVGRRIVLAVACALPLAVVGSTAPGQEETRKWRGGRLGESLAAIPDLDGDGAPEIVAGAPLAHPEGRDGAGQVLILSGRTGTPLASLDGTAPKERFGTSVAGCPDIDGDGVPEILASTDGWEHDEAKKPRGQCCVKLPCTVKVYSGRGAKLLLTLTADGPRGAFGHVLEGVPDLDGDGRGDILVGVDYPTSTPSGRLLPPGDEGTGRAGEVRGYSGKDGTLRFTVRPPEGRNWTRLSLARHPDANADGTPDLLVGAAYAREVYVCSGKDGAILRTISGQDQALRFGASVASLRDQNDDRVPDILVGSSAPWAGRKNPPGRALVVSGRDGTTLRELLEPEGSVEPATGFGELVGVVGDTDGDGVQDFLACAPFAGVTKPYLTGIAHVYSGKDGARRFSVEGQPRGRFGQTGVCPGDLNGDLVPDIVLGAPWSVWKDSKDTSAGEVIAVSGRDGQVLWQVTGRKWE